MTPTLAGETPPQAAPFRMRTVMVPLIAIIIGIFMVVLDGTAVNVALPMLVTDFRTTLPTLQWIVTGYTLAQAAVIPLAGWLSDRYGAKRIFLTSVILFTIGSVLCSTAQNVDMLILFRVLQGLGGGFVLPVAMAYVYRISPPDRVGAIMGMMGIPILFAPAIGPVLGGWLVQYASWRWIFLLNLPVGIIGIVVGVLGLPEVQRQAVAALDRMGGILGPLAFAALSYGVSEGATSWTSTNTIGGLAVGVVALVAFIAVELRAQNPLLELRVFKSFDFSVAIVAQWVGQTALFGSLFLVPLFLQQVRGLGAFDTGLAILPQAIAAGIMMPIGGMLFDRIGARPLVVGGLGLVGVATYLLGQVGVHTQAGDLDFAPGSGRRWNGSDDDATQYAPHQCRTASVGQQSDLVDERIAAGGQWPDHRGSLHHPDLAYYEPYRVGYCRCANSAANRASAIGQCPGAYAARPCQCGDGPWL